jgi:murein L,D-transpeptidase YcbB/YkuD
MRLRTILLATTLSFAVSAAFAQQAPAPTQTPLPQPKPVKRGVASFWTSPEPTFDEGTYDRINAAMLSYSALEVRGGWPQVARVNLNPGDKGDHVARLRQRLAVTEDSADRGRRGRRL